MSPIVLLAIILSCFVQVTVGFRYFKVSQRPTTGKRTSMNMNSDSPIPVEPSPAKPEVSTSGAEKRRPPKLLSFKASSNSVINFPDAANAVQYLSLPASEYRLLNFTFVERQEGRDDLFLLKFPLRQLSSALESVVGASNIKALAVYELCGSIYVNVKPTEGRICMRSDEFYFQRIHKDRIEDFNKTPLYEEEELQEFEDAGFNTSTLRSATHKYPTLENDNLPSWLLWSNSNQQHGIPNTTVQAQKSFLQPFFQAEITWNSRESNKGILRPNKRVSWKDMFSFQGLKSNETPVNDMEDLDSPSNIPKVVESFQANLHVSLGADLHIQPGNNVYTVMKATPVKVMVEKMISLSLKKVLSERKELFGEALIKDCNDRFGSAQSS